MRNVTDQLKDLRDRQVEAQKSGAIYAPINDLIGDLDRIIDGPAPILRFEGEDYPLHNTAPETDAPAPDGPQPFDADNPLTGRGPVFDPDNPRA